VKERRYYTLMGSLPALPRFDRAPRLPLSRERFAARLEWLHAEDRAVLHQAEGFIAWQGQPLARTDEEVLERYRAFVAGVRYPALRVLTEQRMGLRTIVAGLRRRARGEGVPRGSWGIEPWASHMSRHWAEPDFRLGRRVPWLQRASEFLAAGEAVALERLLMGLVWDQQGAVAAREPFAFPAVLAYRFKWDLTERWLSQSVDAARGRIARLVDEALLGTARVEG
jgi:hypothetical protein